MCGICGKLGPSGTSIDEGLLRRMLATIRHRGPDDEGVYVSGRVGLGMRRLSIIDLESGRQPISNEDGTVWIVFNGEIYNYRGLRDELLSRGHQLKTQTDTEVIVHLYEELGPGCVDKLRGMFAFALWDERKELLLLARDRVGIKPLYYYRANGSLVFGSEIKAILADPTVKREVRPEIIDRFLTYFFIPGEETLLKDFSKLPPGSYLVATREKTEIRQYWDLRFTKREKPPSLEEAKRELIHILDESVRFHMISDVPVGVLLSGGVDSTAALSFAVHGSRDPLSTYTVGFSEASLADERPYARMAAEKFGTKHYEMTISARDFVDFMPRFIWHMEEPICDAPSVALYYVSKLASQHVKVLISGEGGDEAFAGYTSYRNFSWLERTKKLLRPFNGAVGSTLSALNRVLRSRKIAKYAPLWDLPLQDYYYSRTSSPFRYFNKEWGSLYTRAFRDQVSKPDSVAIVRRLFANRADCNLLDQMLYVDTKTALPDDLLLKADKMTMANSVELRVPFLDHGVLEFAASLPDNFKLRGLTTKYVIKQALGEVVPEQILNRPKAGFPVPYEAWLRNELRDWVRDIVLDREALGRGYFERRAVEDLLERNDRTGEYGKEVFGLVILELWHRTFLDAPAQAERAAGPSMKP